MARAPSETAKLDPRPGGIRQFRRRASEAIEDGRLQGALEGATGRFRDSRVDALESFPDADELRDHFKALRASTLAHLADHIERFEQNAQEAGARVHRAADGEQACQIVTDIAQRHGVELVTKSKSMLTEEIHLNQALQEAGITPVETDLGEFIIQLADEPPFHILAPAIHKTKDQVAGLFTEESGHIVEADDIPKLTVEARNLLREKFLAAGMGITGGNIGVAESGSVVLVTNEGNGEMVTALPPVHVVVIGVEKIAPTWDDAAVWLALLARSATGQPLSIYTTMITGPARQEDPDGPGELHIILVDNGRDELLGSKYEEALQCIRCGACLNVCPVYREAGGHAYGSPYSGPIGAVISPLLFGLEEYEGLPQASSLCGACLDVCPARIDLPRMLLELRADEVEQRILPWYERWAEVGAATVFEHERLLRMATAVLRLLQRPFIREGRLKLPARLNPTPDRQLPHLANRAFRDIWKDMGTSYRQPGDGEKIPVETITLQSGGIDKSPALNQPTPSIPWQSRRRYMDLSSQFKEALLSAGGEVWVTASLDEALDKVGELLVEIKALKGITNQQEPFQSLDLHSRWPGVGWRVAGQGDRASFRAFSAGADIGLSAADRALAETGSVAVSSGSGLSRFTALLPPVHVVLVPTSCLTTDIFSWAATPPSPFPAAVTLISGPSKTADIEQTLTTGVHGPKRFIAILYEDGR